MLDKVIFRLDAEEVNRGDSNFEGYCNVVEKEYGVSVETNNIDLIITGEKKDITALIYDGQFSSFVIEDMQVEYDRQHGVPELLQGYWDM